MKFRVVEGLKAFGVTIRCRDRIVWRSGSNNSEVWSGSMGYQ